MIDPFGFGFRVNSCFPRVSLTVVFCACFSAASSRKAISAPISVGCVEESVFIGASCDQLDILQESFCD